MPQWTEEKKMKERKIEILTVKETNQRTANRRLLSVAGQWLVGQRINKFKRQSFVENSVPNIATEQQPPNVISKSPKIRT
ncbi:MAG: hypothetical protein A2X08_15245 [Bacteroidetes bacterium GWA2_32_17]|nr:MAG: hypothetical protein A2X08_15245 [Bacteroidetes bacterium GWA2_32_17]